MVSARYLAKRLGSIALTVFFITLIAFFVVRVLPGDPAVALLGEDASPQELAAWRKKLGVDKPLMQQYVDWLRSLVRGDLGKSVFTGKPVIELLATRLPLTALLTIYAMALAIAISIPLGTLIAIRRGTWLAVALSSISLIGVSIPNFWLGIVLIMVFSVLLRLFTAYGFVSPLENPLRCLASLFLPALALASYAIGVLTRQVYSSVLEALSQDFVVAARSRGLPERVVLVRYVLRNALIPAVTMAAILVGYFLGGSILIETVFAIPGMGTMLLKSALSRDYYVVQGFVLVYALLFALSNLASALLYTWLNPKVRYS